MDRLMTLQIPWSASLHCPMLGWVGPLWSLTRTQVFFGFASEARSYGKVSAWKSLAHKLATLVTTLSLSWSAL